MTKTQALKATLAAHYPANKFSVRKTRNNGWVGQVIEVDWIGELTNSDIFWLTEEFEHNNFGHTIYLNGKFTK